MKKLIIFMVFVALATPSAGLAIEQFKRTGEIKMDESGGYSESQRDHHSRRKKQEDAKTDSGYYNGEYHNTGSGYQPGEWQFVDKDKGGSSKKKSYKKVKETDTKKK